MIRRLLMVAATALAFILSTAGAANADHWLTDPDTGERLHWMDNDPTYPRGYIYWVDNTGPEWPVYSSAVEWDKATRLDAVYVSSEASCPVHCVSINQTDLGTPTTCGPNTYGLTNHIYHPSTGHYLTETYSRVDQQCGTGSYNFRRTITCHEMGHTIGMYEQISSTAVTCMRSPYTTPATLPSTHDYDAIHVTYNHND